MVNNNTPDRLYYYCENHPKMGGVINITGTDQILMTPPLSITDWNYKNATVEIADCQF